MPVVAYKNRGSELRSLLKLFKQRFDDVSLLRRYEPTLRRILFLSSNPQDQSWRAEAFHQLALLYQAEGRVDLAQQNYVRSLEAFRDYEHLGLARAMRDYGMFMAMHHEPRAGLSQIEQALELHDLDLRNRKGERQRRITESYVWRARMLVDVQDEEARDSLIDFALTDSRDCCLRDQLQAIEFLLPYVDGVQRQLLDGRIIEIHAKRRNLGATVMSMVKFVIDAELYIASKVVLRLLGKE